MLDSGTGSQGEIKTRSPRALAYANSARAVNLAKPRCSFLQLYVLDVLRILHNIRPADNIPEILCAKGSFMAADEFQELHEHAEHAAHNPSMAPVSLTMAILAVLLAVVSLLGMRSHEERLMFKSEANDQWAFYQAKDIRLHMDKAIADFEAFVANTDAAKAAQARQANLAEVDKYTRQTQEIQTKANELDVEAEKERRRGDRFDLGEVFLDIGLVITSVTLLSGRRVFWHAGIVLAVIGIVAASTDVLVK